MNTEANGLNDYATAYTRFLTYVESDLVFKSKYLNKVPDIVGMTEETRVICLNKVYGPLSSYTLTNVPITYYTDRYIFTSLTYAELLLNKS